MVVSGPTPMALVYPNHYDVGMSSLGFQTVYRLFNEQPQFHCERVFVYENPFAFHPYTLESQTPLHRKQIIAFSVAYELDYVHVLLLLRAAGVSLLAKDRTDFDPLIIIGGVTCFYNPNIMAPFADVLFIGEAEPLLPTFTAVYQRYGAGGRSKAELLTQLARFPGFYVPSIHGLTPAPGSIQRQFYEIETAEPATSFCVSKNMHMPMFLVEVGRGCGRGCKFCSAGHVYRPHRYWPTEVILSAVDRYAAKGDRIGLVGAALSDFRELDHLCVELLKRGHPLGLSSLRADRISPTLLDTLAASGINSITLAPEAGTEEMRRRLHKNLSDQQIMAAIDLIADSHISSLKLYFMIGLPQENTTDLQAIVFLVKNIAARLLSRNKKRELRVSINTFVPKPWTPFQWAAMVTEREIKEKRRLLYQALQKIPGVSISRKSAHQELLQGIFSLGGAKVGLMLAECIEKQKDWSRLYLEWTEWLHREKSQQQVFPWDCIDNGIDKNRLWRSWKRSLNNNFS